MSHPVHYLLVPPPSLSLAVYTRFLDALPGQAHLLNAHCSIGEELAHFRQLGHVVTACEPRLESAKIASRKTGQAVRVCRIEQLRSVLPYDGIWVSSELDDTLPVFTLRLQHLANLLKPGAPLGIRISPNPRVTADVIAQIQRLITQHQIPLRLCLHDGTSATETCSNTLSLLLIRCLPSPL